MDAESFFLGEAADCRRAAGGLPYGDAKRGLVQLAAHYEREAKRAAIEEAARHAPNVRRYSFAS